MYILKNEYTYITKKELRYSNSMGHQHKPYIVKHTVVIYRHDIQKNINLV